LNGKKGLFPTQARSEKAAEPNFVEVKFEFPRVWYFQPPGECVFVKNGVMDGFLRISERFQTCVFLAQQVPVQ